MSQVRKKSSEHKWAQVEYDFGSRPFCNVCEAPHSSGARWLVEAAGRQWFCAVEGGWRLGGSS